MPLSDYLADSIKLLSATLEAGLEAPMEEAIARTTEALGSRRPMLICGNGGSAYSRKSC